MPYIRIWIHTVWATRNNEKFLDEEIRRHLFDHILKNAQLKNIIIDCIGGYFEHVHCLIQLQSDQNVATILQLLKGESSFWLNRAKLTTNKFGWQDEYFAVSVSESQIDHVRQYILNQEGHHKKKTFQQEYEEFISKYLFEND